MNDNRDMFLINIGNYYIDPLEAQYHINSALFSNKKSVTGHYIVQFKGTLSRSEIDEIKKHYKLKLSEYIPNFSYLEFISKEDLHALYKNRLVRVIIPYHPSFKISSNIRFKHDSSNRSLAYERKFYAIHFPESNRINLGDSSINGHIKSITSRMAQQEQKSYWEFYLESIEQLENLIHNEDVKCICEVEITKSDNGTTSGTLQSGHPGITPYWDAGLHGEYQVIGIMDKWMDIDHCFFRDDTDNRAGTTHRKIVGLRKHERSNPTEHGTFVAGIALGDDVSNPGGHLHRGIAWNARLSFTDKALRHQGDETRSMHGLLVAEFKDGAFIHNSSWHEDIPVGNVQYTSIAYDVDKFMWNYDDNLVIASASESSDKLGPPATSKNCLCVAATSRFPDQNEFGDGASGPTQDGRRKPEIMAPGCQILSSKYLTNCEIFERPCASSWAAPAVTGVAAIVRQYYMEGFYPSSIKNPSDKFTPSGVLIKATLLNGTVPMTDIPEYPNDLEGWGLLSLNHVLPLNSTNHMLYVEDVRNSHGLMTGESHTYTMNISTSGLPLKITLAFNDPPPAIPNVLNPIVNNLDLRVTSPDKSQVFLGNAFSGGISVTGGTPDRINNVEMILIPNPIPGAWLIEVIGEMVNVGAPGQGYALVVTSDFGCMGNNKM